MFNLDVTVVEDVHLLHDTQKKKAPKDYFQRQSYHERWRQYIPKHITNANTTSDTIKFCFWIINQFTRMASTV